MKYVVLLGLLILTLTACGDASATSAASAPASMSAESYDEGSLTADLLDGLGRIYPQDMGESDAEWCTVLAGDPPVPPSSLGTFEGGDATIYAACMVVKHNDGE